MNKKIQKNKIPQPPDEKLLRRNKQITREIRITRDFNNNTVNRSCSVRPKQHDFSQVTEVMNADKVIDTSNSLQYAALEREDYSSIPTSKVMIDKKIGVNVIQKNDKSPGLYQDSDIVMQKVVKTEHDPPWQNLHKVSTIEKLINEHDKDYHQISDIHISEIPRVKIIAEKFSKFKQNNIELRRLEEKVVCVEYDVYDQCSDGTLHKVVQTMRAFFSIAPVQEYDYCDSRKVLTELPSKIKHKFDILDEDLKKLTQKEMDIIDGQVEENKCYLDDLKRILRRRNANHEKRTLHLNKMYEIAKRGSDIVGEYSKANFLSNDELEQVKQLILEQCASSIHGKRKMAEQNESIGIKSSVLSGSIAAELLREDEKINVFN